MDIKISRVSRRLILLSAFLMLAGCQTGVNKESSDPLESINRPIYGFNDSLDRNILQPVAKGYVAITPKPVRKGVTNFFSNLTYLNVILNDVLQGKFAQGLDDTARFIINSTVGIAGIMNPAGHSLPQNNEDFGQTLGTWGVGEGAYLNLPVLGPSSTRDAPGIATSILTNPLTYFASAITIPVTAVNVINTRANLLDASEFRDDAALDPYAFTREAYRQQRTSLIHDGNPPAEDFDDFFDEEDFEDEASLNVE